jgi:CRISPR-associated protein Csd1
MLISALNDYYEILIDNKKIAEEGYSEQGISYVIVLRKDGTISNIIDVRNKREEVTKKGKIKITIEPKSMLMPERPRSTSVKAYFVENRPAYIFGLRYKSKDDNEWLEIDSPDKNNRMISLKHEALVQEIDRDFSDIDSEIARSYLAFSRTWNPEKELNNSKLLGLKKDLNGAKFAFCVEADLNGFLHKDPAVKTKWNQLRATPEKDNGIICQDSVTGENEPVAEVHDAFVQGKDIGILNAGIGPTIVNFKPESFNSYGHKQGENACISKKVMKRYTRAMNYLLSSPKNHSYLDGMTLMFWSMDGNEANDSLISFFLNQQHVSRDELDNELKKVIELSENGTLSEERIVSSQSVFTNDADYYIVGLEPNGPRVQVKFIYRQKFGKFLQNITKHQKDIRMSSDEKPVSLARIKRELVSPKADNATVNDAQFSTVLNSVLNGGQYPTWLIQNIVMRIRTDHSDTKFNRMNIVRAGIVKGCLIRHEKEEIEMALDRENNNPAYLCGRAFAVLQKIQEDSAYPNKLNRTIEDAYLGSASVNPASVMPKLLQLSRFHLKKLQKNYPGRAVNDQRELDSILCHLGSEFPRTQGIYDQGRFLLGYYQQNAEKYKKSEEKENKEEEN